MLVVEDVLLLLEEGELTGALDEEELTDALEVAAADDTGVDDDDPKNDEELLLLAGADVNALEDNAALLICGALVVVTGTVDVAFVGIVELVS